MQVMFFSLLRQVVKTDLLEIEASTVGQLLDQLAGRFGSPFTKLLLLPDGALRKDFAILVNGRNIEFLQGLETPLREEDIVALIPPAAGG